MFKDIKTGALQAIAWQSGEETAARVTRLYLRHLFNIEVQVRMCSHGCHADWGPRFTEWTYQRLDNHGVPMARGA